MSSEATAQNPFEVEWEKFKAAAAADEAKIASTIASFVPVVEADLDQFFETYAPVAAASILKLAGEEFAALTGAEKQSQVITDLVQAAEADGATFGAALRTYAITLAQDAYAKIAAIVTAA